MKFSSGIKTFFYGLCLGISLLPPGFSAATMAMVLGIYEDLINLLNEIFSKSFKRALKPLAMLASGAVVAIAVFSQIISILMENFPYQTRFFFLGLIAATIPLVLKESNFKEQFKLKHYALLLIVSFTVILLSFNMLLDPIEFSEGLTVFGVMFLLFAGMLVASSMILPGLSGALMLILIGAYEFLLESISSFDLTVIGIVAAGGLLGLVVSGRFIKHMLSKNETIMYAVSIGFIVSSIPIMLRYGMPYGMMSIVSSGVMFVLGGITVMSLNLKKR